MGGLSVDRQTMLATEKKMREQQQLFTDILPDSEANFGLDPSWVKIYPYIIQAALESRSRRRFELQNYKPSAMKLEVALVAPSEWRIEPDVVRMEVGGNSSGTSPSRSRCPRTGRSLSASCHRGRRGKRRQIPGADYPKPSSRCEARIRRPACVFPLWGSVR